VRRKATVNRGVGDVCSPKGIKSKAWQQAPGVGVLKSFRGETSEGGRVGRKRNAKNGEGLGRKTTKKTGGGGIIRLPLPEFMFG